MRVLVVCVGSRGDTEPFSALATEIAEQDDYDVDLFVLRDYKHLAPNSAKITVHELPFATDDFYKYVANPSHGTDDPDPRARFVGVVTDCIGELVLPQWKQVLNAASACNFLVASSLARPLLYALSHKLHVPMATVNLQPLVPTHDFPHFSQVADAVSVLSNKSPPTESHLGTWLKLEKLHYEFLLDRVTAVCESLDVAPPSFESHVKRSLCGEDPGMFVVNAFSDQLVPHPSDAGPYVWNVGPLAADYVPSDWKPPSDLEQFLATCRVPPVCVGFGSMPFDKPMDVVRALKELDRPGVLVGAAFMGDLEQDEWQDANVFCVPAAPYAWLLPRCCLMLSHGGAGVLHATLAAGVPAAVAPFLSDQFFWAELVKALGLGVRCGEKLQSLTVETVKEAVVQAESCTDACAHLADELKKRERPARVLVKRIVEVCNREKDNV